MDNYFTLNLPIFKTENDGKLLIPEKIKKLWFDVGTSINSPNSIHFLKRNPDGFAMGFEADPRMYFTIYAANYFADNLWLLDPNHPSAKMVKDLVGPNERLDEYFRDGKNIVEYLPAEDILNRYILVPTAISNQEGHSNLHFDSHHGSSMLTNNNSDFKICVNKLETFINMVPDRFEYIDHLKVDAEGYDEEVLLSAGKLLDKFVVITTEMNTSSYLTNNGFEFIKEQNGGYSFVNKKLIDKLPNIDYSIRI